MFTSTLENNIFIIRFQENLIMPTLDADLQQAIEDCIEKGTLHCIINLEGVQYANSSGIGILMRILAKFRNVGGESVLLNPSAHLQKLLIITKLSAIFTVATSMDEAVKVLKG
jgi:anti-sigma B factor antagonist